MAPADQRRAPGIAAMEASLMKVIGIISTTALFLLLGTTVSTFAQEEHHEQEAKPAQHEEQAKPAKQQEQAKPAQHEEQAKTEKQPEAKPAKQEAQPKPAKQEEHAKTEKAEPQAKPAKEEKQAKPAKQEEHAKTEKQESQPKQVKQEDHSKPAAQQHAQRSAAEVQRQRSQPALRLSSRGSGHIPDERFHSNFGREHVFRISSPRIVDGYSRFQYGGYWFGFVQPWPVGWYYTDDVYVDFIDGGYYLYNPYYPDDRVSISVVL
jgi:primosomal protein N'